MFSETVRHSIGKEASVYGFVGLFSTVIYLIISMMLVALTFDEALASVISYFCASAFSYFGHRVVTFRSEVQHGRAVRRFTVVAVFGLSISYFVPQILVKHKLATPTVSFFIVALSISVVSFVVLRLFVFNLQKQTIV